MEMRDRAGGRAILMCAGDYQEMDICRRPGDLVVAVDAGLGRLLDQGIAPDIVLGDFDSLEEKYFPYIRELEKRRAEGLYRLPCEKDDTDTLYAARVCLQRGYREVLIYGGLGGRLDHTVANIQTLAWIRRQGGQGYLMGKRGDRTSLATVIGRPSDGEDAAGPEGRMAQKLHGFCQAAGGGEKTPGQEGAVDTGPVGLGIRREGDRILLPEGFEGIFSLFALDRRIRGVTLQGMKYPLSDAVLENTFPLGVSNEVRRGNGGAFVRVGEGLALMVLEWETGANQADALRHGRARTWNDGIEGKGEA